MDSSPVADSGTPALSARRSVRERDIVRSARRSFAARGFDQTAVADIARDVGVAEGTIYTYFESKRALLHRVIAEFYEPLITEAELALRGIAGVRNKLRYLIWRQLRAFVEERELCYLIIRELQPTADSYDSIVVGLARRYTALAIRVVEEGIRSGEIRPGVSPFLVRAIIYGSVENIAWRLTFRGKPMDIEQIADDVVNVLCQGIAQPADRIEATSSVEALEALVRELREIIGGARLAQPPQAPKRSRGITE